MKNDWGKKDLREFGTVLALILAILSFLHFRKGNENLFMWFAGFSGAALISALIFPVLLSPVFRIFLRVAHAIGWFNTRVILIAVYYLILTPIGLVMRFLGKDILDKNFNRPSDTYWRKRAVISADRESLEKQY